jgi:glucose/arabinose dehydrogenase
MRRLGALAVLALAAGGSEDTNGPDPIPSASPGACTPVAGTPALGLARVAAGLTDPLDLQAAPGDRDRLFVVEQPGRIRIVRDSAVLGTPFLDITGRVRDGGERGLLGLAFHPRYAENGRFFVNYTDDSGHTHVAEFRVTADRDVADAASERTVLFQPQPFSNHNGGGLAFGNDGMLYIALGDGGSGGDPQGNAQNPATLLGKVLRIDVDRGTPYGIPADNPFLGQPGFRQEVWALGLRNPWRYSFDRLTGDLYVGDVGQGTSEEVSVGLAARRGGENYGWNVMEGTGCFRPSSGCSTAGLTLPVLTYPTREGCAVTGGYVYRGCRMPGYHGTYFYGDYCAGFVRSFRLVNGQATEARSWPTLGAGVDNISSFGVDADGELYIVDHTGEVYKVVPPG